MLLSTTLFADNISRNILLKQILSIHSSAKLYNISDEYIIQETLTNNDSPKITLILI